MAPQRIEKIESQCGNGMGSDASNLQHLVHGREADRGSLDVTGLQKKAPYALKSLDAERKSPRTFLRYDRRRGPCVIIPRFVIGAQCAAALKATETPA
jgi:hypothetical protein